MALPALDIDGGAVDEERWLRLRVLLTEYRTVVLIALLVVVALGAWVSYGAYASPGEKTVQQREHAWTATGDVSHEATVTEPNTVYPVGAQLRNEPLYYTAISPTVDVEFAAGYESPTAENVSVGLTADLVYRAVGSDDETVYWSERERLASTSERGVRPGTNVTTSVTVNATAITERITEIESDLGAAPGQTEIYLVLERDIDGTIAGERRSVTDSYRVPITTEAGTYRLETDDAYDEAYEDREAATVPASAGPLRTVGGPLLLLIGLGGLAGLRVATNRLPEPSAAEREWLTYRDDHDQFEEVITPMSLPETALEGPRAELERLASLAEFGIDVGAAIVFDPARELYVVRDDGVTYVFDPPARPWAAGRPASDADPDDEVAFSNTPDLSAAEAESASARPESDPEPATGRADGIDDDDLLGLAGLEEADLLDPEPRESNGRSDDD